MKKITPLEMWKERALKAESREHSTRMALETAIERHVAILSSLVWHREDVPTVKRAIEMMRAVTK